MNTKGQHLLMDIWYDQDIAPIVVDICEVVRNNFKVVETAHHQFEPQGETIVYILSESHFTIHTYPEHNYVSLDIYICNPDYNLAEVADKILEIAPAIDYNAALDSRGVKNS
jgi:S-adenosylmethionine decarboxylase